MYISALNATTNRPSVMIRHRRLQVTLYVKRDNKSWINKLVDQAQTASEVGDLRTTYQIAKQISNKAFSSNRPNKNLAEFTNDEQMRRWTENLIMIAHYILAFFRPPSTAEICMAIQYYFNNKNPCGDGLPVELLQADLQESAQHLQQIIEQVWATKLYITN